MTRRIPALWATFLLVALCPAQQPTLFRTEVNLMNVSVLVRSSDGSLITGLGKDDFEVLEDGVPQRIQFFAREKEIPLSLGLVVDVSGSQDKFIKQHNKDVELFLSSVLSPADRAVAICFGNHLRLVSDATSSPDRIMHGLQSFAKGDRDFSEIGPKESRDLGTALYDALYFTTKEKLNQADERRKAIVLFSDGEENSSEHDLLDAVEAVQNADTIVYSIRYTNREKESRDLNARNKYGIRVMKHLATLSGGSEFDALKANLGDVFSEIGMELHSLYSIGYLSTNPNHDGSFRKLTIRCKASNSFVRARSGYYAR
jgi:Ca-activated chloride channel family protein